MIDKFNNARFLSTPKLLPYMPHLYILMAENTNETPEQTEINIYYGSMQNFYTEHLSDLDKWQPSKIKHKITIVSISPDNLRECFIHAGWTVLGYENRFICISFTNSFNDNNFIQARSLYLNSNELIYKFNCFYTDKINNFSININFDSPEFRFYNTDSNELRQEYFAHLKYCERKAKIFESAMENMPPEMKLEYELSK